MGKPKAGKPRPFHVGPVKVNVVRGPHKDEPERWYWQGRVFRDSKAHTVWSGWATVAGALAAVSDVVAILGGNVDVAPQRQAHGRSTTTVRDLLEMYVAAVQASGKSAGRKRQVEVTGSRICKVIGDISLNRLGGEHQERYALARSEETKCLSTVEHEISILRAAYNWGLERGISPERLWRKAKIDWPHKGDHGRNLSTPSFEDYRKVLEAARQKSPQWVYRVVLIGGYTGMRLQEMVRLEWDAVDLERREAHIQAGEGIKTGARTVPLPSPVVEELEGTPEHERTGRVLAGPTIESQRFHAWKRVAMACKRAGVPRFTVHALRRLAVDRLYASGVDPATCASILGHSEAVALRHYRRTTEEEKRRAMALAFENVTSLGKERAKRAKADSEA